MYVFVFFVRLFYFQMFPHKLLDLLINHVIKLRKDVSCFEYAKQRRPGAFLKDIMCEEGVRFVIALDCVNPSVNNIEILMLTSYSVLIKLN